MAAAGGGSGGGIDAAANVDDFEKLFLLGTGRVSTVWAVRYGGGQQYAMKVLAKAKVSNVKQVLEEKKVMTLLEGCPYTPTLHKTLKDATNLYFVMDAIKGGDLNVHIKRAADGRLPLKRARLHAAEVAVALAAMHAAGAVHRDVKANNVIVGADGRCTLVDFGFAKVIGSDGRTGTYCGTPHAMAPEVIQGHKYGTAVDWWGLGILLYEMVVGVPPFGNGGGEAAAGSDTGTTTSGADTGATDEKKEEGSASPELPLHRIVLAGLPGVKWPTTVFGTEEGKSCADCIRKLLCPDPAKRLGAAGFDQVAASPFFASIDWAAVRDRRHDVCPWDATLTEFTDEVDGAVDAALFADF